MALAASPNVLIADEPTTALDATVAAQVMELLQRLRRDRGLTLLLITHDLGLVARHADRALVLYAGRVAEESGTAELFREPRHPYTRGLLASAPRVGAGDGLEASQSRMERHATHRLPRLRQRSTANGAEPLEQDDRGRDRGGARRFEVHSNVRGSPPHAMISRTILERSMRWMSGSRCGRSRSWALHKRRTKTDPRTACAASPLIGRVSLTRSVVRAVDRSGGVVSRDLLQSRIHDGSDVRHCY